MDPTPRWPTLPSPAPFPTSAHFSRAAEQSLGDGTSVGSEPGRRDQALMYAFVPSSFHVKVVYAERP